MLAKSFIAKFEPRLQKLIGAARRELRRRFPTAVEVVYDNYNFLVFGFCTTERTGQGCRPFLLLGGEGARPAPPAPGEWEPKPFPSRSVRGDVEETRGVGASGRRRRPVQGAPFTSRTRLHTHQVHLSKAAPSALRGLKLL